MTPAEMLQAAEAIPTVDLIDLIKSLLGLVQNRSVPAAVNTEVAAVDAAIDAAENAKFPK